MIKWLEKIFNFFRKKDKNKLLNEGKKEKDVMQVNNAGNTNDVKKKFIESLKVDTPAKKKESNVETIICDGDGSGIDTRVYY